MRLRDRMIYAAIVTCDMKRRHTAYVREFYRDLLHVCDDHGRFEANASLLRAVLFASILDRVSVRDVQGYLQSLHLAGDIKLYTVRGKGLGKVTKWRQLRLKKKVADYPDEDGDIELNLDTHDPPDEDEGKKEGSVSRERSPAPVAPPHTHGMDLAENHLAALAERWPMHNIESCLRQAQKYVRNERGSDAAVSLGWFEKHWLPKAAKDNRRRAEALKIMEPINFEEWYLDRYEKPPGKKWAEMKADDQAYYIDRMGFAAKFSDSQGAA